MYSTFSDFQSRIEEKVHERPETSPELSSGDGTRGENSGSFTGKTGKCKKNQFFLRKGVAKIAIMWYNVSHNIRGLNESHVI